MRLLALLSLVGLCLASPDAFAITVLTANKTLRFEQAPGARSGSALVRFSDDPALAELVSPLCPTRTTLQLSTYLNPGPVVELPCANWVRQRDGYRYDDRAGTAGGVRRIRYEPGRLEVFARGPGYAHRPGPDAFAQLRFHVGDTRYVGRFHDLPRNDPFQIRSRKPTPEGASAEALFWETLLDDPDRDVAALAAAGQAVARRSNDARSWFLKGMMHLRRYQRITPDQHAPGPASRAHLAAARDAFERAAEQNDYDPRLVGFRGAATFASGFAENDPAMMDAGLELLRESFALDPLFNIFNFVGTVAAVVDASDPRYAEAMVLLDDVLANVFDCVTRLPEVCLNEGFAPHNLQGTFLMFGDLFAKRGDAAEALRWYTVSADPTVPGNASWDYQAQAEARIRDLDRNLALWGDGDPNNDPGISGAYGESACILCHHR